MKHPCVFRGSWVRTQVDPRIQSLWRKERHESAPFAYLRKIWRDQHCATLNPYGSENCPYEEEACAVAFWIVASQCVDADDPKARFYARAKDLAITRADNKPLMRDRITNDGSQGPGNSAPPRTGHPARPSAGVSVVAGAAPGDGVDIPDVAGTRTEPLHGGRRGFEPIREVLRKIDPGARQGPINDGKESTK